MRSIAGNIAVRVVSGLAVLAVWILWTTEIDWSFGKMANAIVSGGIPARSPVEHVRSNKLVRRLSSAIIASDTNDMSRARNLAAWIATSLSVSDSANLASSPEDMLRLLTGVCGDRDWLYSSVAHTLGWGARRINFFHVPLHGGHTATEVYIDGGWRFFDATFGMYISEVESSEPIGIAEARRRFPRVWVWKLAAPIWTGTWQDTRAFEWVRMPADGVVRTHSGTILADIKRTYFASRMQGALEEDILWSEPIVALDEQPRGQIGARDGSLRELIGPYDVRVGDVLQYLPAIYRIGVEEATTYRRLVGLRVTFLTKTPRLVEFSLQAVAGGPQPLVDLDQISGDYSLEWSKVNVIATGEKRWTFCFNLLPPGARGTLTLRTGRVDVDAVEWKSEHLHRGSQDSPGTAARCAELSPELPFG